MVVAVVVGWVVAAVVSFAVARVTTVSFAVASAPSAGISRTTIRLLWPFSVSMAFVIGAPATVISMSLLEMPQFSSGWSRRVPSEMYPASRRGSITFRSTVVPVEPQA